MRTLFIHHSTGGNLLKQGKIREKLYSKSSDIELWDHGYNLRKYLPNLLANIGTDFHTGLSDKNGKPTGTDFDLEISNRDVSCYLGIFDPSHPSFEKMLEFDSIIFKMCFPSTSIKNDEELERIKNTYAEIAENLSKHSNKFGVFTSPPLRMEQTTSDSARRAVSLTNWMVNELPNKDLRVFDFFGLLSSKDKNSEYFGTLKRKYCRAIRFDSHPNRKANIYTSEFFLDFIMKINS